MPKGGDTCHPRRARRVERSVLNWSLGIGRGSYIPFEIIPVHVFLTTAWRRRGRPPSPPAALPFLTRGRGTALQENAKLLGGECLDGVRRPTRLEPCGVPFACRRRDRWRHGGSTMERRSAPPARSRCLDGPRRRSAPDTSCSLGIRASFADLDGGREDQRGQAARDQKHDTGKKQVLHVRMLRSMDAPPFPVIAARRASDHRAGFGPGTAQ
jgi:hypothetical protein